MSDLSISLSELKALLVDRDKLAVMIIVDAADTLIEIGDAALDIRDAYTAARAASDVWVGVDGVDGVGADIKADALSAIEDASRDMYAAQDRFKRAIVKVRR